MKSIHLAALTSVFALAPFALAQSQPTPEPSAAVSADVSDSSDSGSERFDLKLDRTPLPDLIDYLSEKTKKNIVLMVPPNTDAASIFIPPLKLKHVSLDQILELVTNIPGVQMSYDTSGEGESTIYILSVVECENPAAAAAPQWRGFQPPAMVRGQALSGALAGIQTNEPYLSVIPLERMLMGAYPSDRVKDEAQRQQLLADRTKQALTLIDQAFQMTPADQAKPEIKLHAETNTLLVKATPQQLQTINQVLAALEVPGQSDSRKDFERQLQDAAMQSDRTRAQMQEEVARRQKVMEEQAAQMAQERAELTKQREELRVEIERLKAQMAARDAQKPQ